jgi:hypothetical protein
MTRTEDPFVLKQFRKTDWKFQVTFKTPLDDLKRFVSTIASAHPLQCASLTIETWVFEPKHLIQLLANNSMPPECPRGLCLSAVDQPEIETLLEAVFADWIDFVFIPEPKRFVLYADHDEYATFYSHRHSDLGRIESALSDQGFALVGDYERHF